MTHSVEVGGHLLQGCPHPTRGLSTLHIPTGTRSLSLADADPEAQRGHLGGQ